MLQRSIVVKLSTSGKLQDSLNLSFAWCTGKVLALSLLPVDCTKLSRKYALLDSREEVVSSGIEVRIVPMSHILHTIT